jgi:type IX secretion system PorP/SprF family membrane protein
MKSKGQQEIMLSQYMFNQLFLNPAYSGTHDYWESSILYRNQWVGWDGAPTSQLIAIDGPILPKLLGIGGTIIHDKIGVSENFSANINLSYQLKLDYKGNHRLSFGLKTGIYTQKAVLKDLIYWDSNDPIYTGNEIVSQNTLLFGAGIYYYTNKYYIGLSIPLLYAKDLKDNPTADNGRSSYLRKYFYLNGGIVIPLSDNIDFKPSFLLKYQKAAPLQADLNLHFLFNDILWLGVSYRTMDAVAIMLEVNVMRWMRIGYAYDITLSKLSNYSSGSHEIMIGIDFGKTIVKTSSPRYF